MSDKVDYTQYAVLYVDDEEQALKYFKRGMEKQFTILTATNVEQALTVLNANVGKIGVIISDQRMPGRSGVELLTEVREKWPAITRILITAYTEIESAVAAVNAGAVYKYINKPADFVVLKQALIDGLDVYRETVRRDAMAAMLLELENQRRATQASEAQREELQQRLVKASREAGRAEVATGILHNVGNVLNSINISAAMVNKTLQESKVTNLAKALAMFEEHANDLAGFLTSDERGQRLPGYLGKLASVLAEEQKIIANEMIVLGRSLEHIVQVVQMQQTYAKVSAVKELVSPAELMEDAVRLNAGAFERNNVTVIREYADTPAVMLDKHRVLQILVNLVTNAKNALEHPELSDRRVTVRIIWSGDVERPILKYQVVDTGTGILPDNLTRIFTHGFTTRKDGHGFGLHSSANAAKEMGGSLTVFSEGANRGATFTVEIPIIADSRTASVGTGSTEKVSA